MLDLSSPASAIARNFAPSAPSVERRLYDGIWLRRSLDCVDYPMICVAGDRTVLVANRAALGELADATHPLQLAAGQLKGREGADVAALQRAMRDAQVLGLRRLVVLGRGAAAVSIAVLPLAGHDDGDAGGRDAAVLLVLGKRKLCESLSADWFARERGLTGAETRVLQGLCTGLKPSEIAARQGVALSTVRTQVRSLRSKTGTPSIRELLRQVSTLPPMLNVLRCVGS